MQIKNKEELLSLIWANGGNAKPVIIFWEDAGHGWLQVPMQLCDKLAISNKISKFSYLSRGFYYLEEDCDLSLFLNAIMIDYNNDELRKLFWDNCPKEYEENSHIRNFKRVAIAG